MTVMMLERVSPSLRGDLSKWLIEVKAGVFVGRINALIRETLWNRCLEYSADGSVWQVWSVNNEQGFDLRCHNPGERIPVDHEGMWLVRFFRDPSWLPADNDFDT